jgi:hypothetical protein
VTVSEAGTTTTISTSKNPTVFEEPVTFTATTTFQPGSPIPGGDMVFTIDTMPPQTVGFVYDPSTATATAQLTVSNLSVNTHTVTAAYLPDTINTPSISSPLSQVVNQAATSTTLTPSATSPFYGQTVSFTARVAVLPPSNGTPIVPTQSVTFSDNGTPLATMQLVGGQAVFSTSKLAAGNHSITASYSGDVNFVGSSAGPVQVQVQKALTAVALTLTSSTNLSPTSNPAPAVYGLPVTFMARVNVTRGVGPAVGSVRFSDTDQKVNITVPLDSNGQATFMTAATQLKLDVNGKDTITAVYIPNSNFAPPVMPGSVSLQVGTPHQLFVFKVLQVVLQRPAVPEKNLADLMFYSTQMDAGVLPAQIVQQIESTTEYQKILVKMVYKQYLNTIPSTSQLNAGVNFLAGGGTVEGLVTQKDFLVAFSKKYGNVDLTKVLPNTAENASFVSGLLLTALGPTRVQNSKLVTLLLSGLSSDTAFPPGQVVVDSIAERARAAQKLFGRNEYLRHLVSVDYQLLLGKSPSFTKVTQLVNKLLSQFPQGATDQQILAFLAAGSDFIQSTLPK